MELAKNELRISITAACNMKCVYCHNEGNKKFAVMTTEQIKKIIEAAKNYNLKKVRITGGEPLVSPYVEEICKTLAEDYNLNVEMNTNGIEVKKLTRMIDNGWLKKVVVGMDYFDGIVSKNSPVGKSSEIIKNNILEIKKHGCDVRIATVYNEDDINTLNIIKWAIDNEIGVRILEIVKDEIDEEYSKKYITFLQFVTNNVNLDWYVDERLQEINGSKNGKTLVKFYHSLCRLGLCNICREIPFRITSNGTAKPCLLSSVEDVNLFEGDIDKKLKKVLEYKLCNISTSVEK